MLARFLHRSWVCGNRLRLYAYVLALLLCRLYFGALFSRQRSFFVYCDMYLRFRGCPVVLDFELSVSACYQKTRRVLRMRRLVLLLLLAAESGGVRCAA